MPHAFRQVDVFGSRPLSGNPVAVVHGADDLDDEQMQLFAQWTNLSETTFLLEPTGPAADYRLRIFTPARELPFAGHPTLGSAHAWLEAGGVPRGDAVVQECAAGLVTLERGERLAFQAPPLIKDGPVEDDVLARVTSALGITASDVVDSKWCDNGPGWVGVLLEDAHAVLALRPDRDALEGLDVGVAGPWRDRGDDGAGDADVEVRAFDNLNEDPVTGSLNASLGQWLAGTVLPEEYVAAQGTAIGRRGRVHVRRVGETVWVGGDTRTTVQGEVRLND
ncbi:PhzF family phenazine biosynthesis protein [Nocardioides anomalus]|uniref:PhzF family phenazine biosynthesis protein n=1 Tax=Nocardioides anomalus TaxID=2712223 RepID=A0A6G6WE43_9ACTN|nr:PhzF family phenazine biosynthesis protein [Nocardioides anomalus]QIG43598.1 PhzF family phenazine biosynthesis protein [Nocardioides anomalus]